MLNPTTHPSNPLAMLLLAFISLSLNGCALRNADAHQLGSVMPTTPDNTALLAVLQFYEKDSNLSFQEDLRIEFGHFHQGVAANLAAIARAHGYQGKQTNTGYTMKKIVRSGLASFEIELIIIDDGGVNSLSNKYGSAKISRKIVKQKS